MGAERGQLRIVKLLLQRGLVDPRDRFGQTPLHLAARNVGVAKLLLAFRADIAARDLAGCSPSDYASPAVKQLFEKATERFRTNENRARANGTRRVPDEITGTDLFAHVRAPELELHKLGYLPKNNVGNHGFIAVHRKIHRATQRNQYPKWYQIL